MFNRFITIIESRMYWTCSTSCKIIMPNFKIFFPIRYIERSSKSNNYSVFFCVIGCVWLCSFCGFVLYIYVFNIIYSIAIFSTFPVFNFLFIAIDHFIISKPLFCFRFVKLLVFKLRLDLKDQNVIKNK